MSKLAKALTAAAGNAGGGEPDPNFNQVSLLLNGDGTDGGQNNTYTDSSSNGNTITPAGTIEQGSVSPFGDNWGVYFSGGVGGDTLVAATTGSTIGTGDFTIEGWFYFNAIGPGTVYTLLDGRTGADTSNLMWAQESNGTWAIQNGAGGAISSGWTSSTFTEGQWYHIAQSRTGGVSRFFVNGVLTGSPADSSNYDSQQYTIGGRYAPNGNNLTGYLSNFRIVAGTALYTSAFTPPTAPLTNITGTLVLTCQSNRFVDNSTNAFTITVSGTPEVTSFSPFVNSEAITLADNGGSAYFDGSSYLTFPTVGVSEFLVDGNFTIESWIYPVSGRTFIFATCGNNSSTRGFNFTTNASYYLQLFGYVSNAVIAAGTTPVPFNQWSHVAATRSGSTVRLFLNGNLEATATNTQTFNPTTNGGIGAPSTNRSFYSNGYSSNVRFLKGTALYTSAFTPPTAPLTAVTNTELLLNFEDPAIFDYAALNNVGTTGNADISTAVVKYGTGSLAFDGTGDYLNFPVNPTLSFGVADFTIEGWMNVASIDATYRTIFIVGAPVQVFSRNGTIECYFNDTDNTSGYIVSNLQGPSSSITANTWHYFTVVRNGTTFTAYVDGVAGTPATGVTAPVATSATGASIGIYSVTSQYPFTGYMDDFRITKGLARYTTNFTPPTAALPTF